MQIADATPRAAPQHHFNAWLVGALSPPLVTRDGAQLLRRRSSAATPTVSPHEFHDLSVGARILAEGGGGAACGLVLPLIFTPMELVKVRRQVMRDDAATSWELARAAWREGGVAALYTESFAGDSACSMCREFALFAQSRKEESRRREFALFSQRSEEVEEKSRSLRRGRGADAAAALEPSAGSSDDICVGTSIARCS